MKIRNRCKVVITMAVLLVVLISTPLTAQAATNVTFNTFTSWDQPQQIKAYTFNAESSSFWVGGTNLQQGIYVTIAQAAVRFSGYSVGTVDGIYGPSTTSGIKLYQKAYNLSQDGIVGTGTWSKLYQTAGTYSSSQAIYLGN